MKVLLTLVCVLFIAGCDSTTEVNVDASQALFGGTWVFSSGSESINGVRLSFFRADNGSVFVVSQVNSSENVLDGKYSASFSGNSFTLKGQTPLLGSTELDGTFTSANTIKGEYHAPLTFFAISYTVTR